ncbi:MAG: helix-turn-helix transcriptional regulator [Actinomycetes bacterium]
MDEWIRMEDIAQELKIPVRTIYYFKEQEGFPETYRFGARHVRVKRDAYERWKAQHLEG